MLLAVKKGGRRVNVRPDLNRRSTGSRYFMPENILIVDDSPSTRQAVSLMLSRNGYTVFSAVDGIDALRKVGEEDVDLVITEINLPNLDGLSLAREIRQGKSRRIPILVFTIENNKEIRERAETIGVCGWLEKPLKPEKLITLVESTLKAA